MNLSNLLGALLPFETPSNYPELEPILEFLNESIIPITVVLCVAAALFGVAIVFLIIKAESADKALEMRRRLTHLIITIMCIAFTLWIFGIVVSNLDNIIGAFRGK